MRPSEIKGALRLHDSVVAEVRQAPAEHALDIRIQLCNYAQADYQPDDPEMVWGTLRFTGVARVEATPDPATLPWAEDRFDGEILEVRPLPADAPEDDGVELVVHTTDYRTRARDVLTLAVFGGEAAWARDP